MKNLNPTEKDGLIPVTVLVQTKNEEAGISACLDGLSDFSEVIVVDSNSADRTAEISKTRGAKVVNFTWNGRYPKKKQWQLDNLSTQNDWVLLMDADEVPTAELIEEMREFFTGDVDEYAAADIPLAYFFEGRELKYGHRVVKRALLHKNRVHFPEMNDLDAPGMGELEGHYQPEVDRKIAVFNSKIKHDDQDPISTWFARHNKYSDWEAYLRTNPNTRREIASRRSKQGRLFEKVPFKPLIFFAYSYIARRGFLDGKEGFDYAMALSHYYWQIELKTEDILRREKNLNEDR